MVDSTEHGGAGNISTSNIPVPDPSLLTTDQLRRELGALREVIETRLHGMDRATALIAEELVKLTADFERRQQAQREFLLQKISSAGDVDQEKFASILRMFEERDVRTAQASTAADQALQAALQAAKELVTAQGEAAGASAVKTETSFTKQIDQLATLIETQARAFNDRLTELKERIDRGEGGDVGRFEQRAEKRLDTGTAISIVAALTAIVGVIIAIAVSQIGQ